MIFIVALILLELGASGWYFYEGKWSTGLMWAFVALGNVAWLMSQKGIGNG